MDSFGATETILSSKDLARIKASILPPVENKNAQDKKERLKKMSDDRMKNWPNTLEAMRKKKENYIKDKEDKAELKRQEIDREEASLKRQERLVTIKKANDLLYEQTDRMKYLKSQIMYAEALHTRKSQEDHRKNQWKEELAIESKYHQLTLEKVRKGEEEEKAKELKKFQQMEEIKQTRREQLADNKARREAIKKAEWEEGQKMKEEAKLRLEQDLKDQEEKQKMIIENNYRSLEASKKDQILKKEIKESEAKALASRDAEVWVIEKRKNDIKRRKDEMFHEMQQTRQVLIDKAVEHLKTQNISHNALMNKQAEEIKAREDQKFADKEEKARREWEETVLSRTAQLERKAREDREKAEIDNKLAAKWKRENEEAIQAEKDKQQRARDAQTKIKLEQLEEGKIRKNKNELERQQEIEQYKYLMSLASSNDERFTETVKQEIAKNVRAGKPVYTLLKALEFTQPPLLAAKTVKKIVNENKEKDTAIPAWK